jgi:hypothetical protein
LPIDVAGRRDEKNKLGAVLAEPESTVTNYATGQQEKVLRTSNVNRQVINLDKIGGDDGQPGGI